MEQGVGDIKDLTYGKTYTITRTNMGGVWVVNDSGRGHYYSRKRFITLIEWRLIKLNKINLED